MRANAGYFAGHLACAAHDEHISFAIGARRIAPLSRLLAGIAGHDWHDAIEWTARRSPWLSAARTGGHPAAHPQGGPNPAKVSVNPWSPRRRTLHPDQRAPAVARAGRRGAIHACWFILTDLGMSSPDKAAAAEHLRTPEMDANANPASAPGQPGRHQEAWHTKSFMDAESAHRAIRGARSEAGCYSFAITSAENVCITAMSSSDRDQSVVSSR
jgi:hypothetical protein